MVSQHEAPIPVVSGDVFNYTHTVTFDDHDGSPKLELHLALSIREADVLTHSATIAIGDRFFWFNPNGPEDCKLYVYSLDPSIYEQVAGEPDIPYTGGLDQGFETW